MHPLIHDDYSKMQTPKLNILALLGHFCTRLEMLLLVTSCYGNGDKLRPDVPLGLYADFTFVQG